MNIELPFDKKLTRHLKFAIKIHRLQIEALL